MCYSKGLNGKIGARPIKNQAVNLLKKNGRLARTNSPDNYCESVSNCCPPSNVLLIFKKSCANVKPLNYCVRNRTQLHSVLILIR
jgi:hypothetical protein